MKKTKIIVVFCIVLMTIFWLIKVIENIYEWQFDNAALKTSENSITNCKVIATYYSYYKNVGLHVRYLYSVDGKRFDNQENFSFYYKDTFQYILKNSILPIAYSRKAPQVSLILLNVNDLNRFGLKQPDSLNWTEQYRRF